LQVGLPDVVGVQTRQATIEGTGGISLPCGVTQALDVAPRLG
jgi:hypothetical protein